jgi:hypothetical protein
MKIAKPYAVSTPMHTQAEQARHQGRTRTLKSEGAYLTAFLTKLASASKSIL